jgi:hypothetical protein
VVNVGPYIVLTVLILGAFGMVITAMILRGQSLNRQHRERIFLAEKGLDIPPELYDKRDSKPRKFNGYKAGRAWLVLIGTLLVFVGIGVTIALGVRDGMDQGVNGVIPLLIGVGLLTAERLIARSIVKAARDE